MQTVASIDPSIRATGYAVLDASNSLLTYGRTPLRTWADVCVLIDKLAAFKPDVVALETTFISVNAKTGIDLAELRGRLRQELESRLIGVQLIAPGTWRKSTIKPPAKAKRKDLKRLAIEYALTTYGVTATDDEADAICIATHLHEIGARGIDVVSPHGQDRGQRELSGVHGCIREGGTEQPSVSG